jgi:3-phosphoshikimate 1-carboxyvinyltransferase
MNQEIRPSLIRGSVVAPASKSSMQRVLAAALLRKGTTVIHNPGKSNDDQSALDTVQKLGATIRWEGADLVVHSVGVVPVSEEINCGESGLGIRMFTPIVALSNKTITVTGTGSLVTRPMYFFDEIFPQLGIKISSQEGKLPLEIKGPLKPATIEVDGSLSSQFLTGLLMAYAASEADGVAIHVIDLKSKPYIDLTIKVLADFGWIVTHDHYKSFYFNNQQLSIGDSREYAVEGDWSGAAFLLVAGAIAGSIEVKGLDIHSTQADRAVLDALKEAGAQMEVGENSIHIQQSSLKAFRFDATECPDLFPPLVALASYCKGETTIAGVNRLAHKESDRGLTLQEEFAKLGVSIRLEGDLMYISGGGKIVGAEVYSHHDHRIAMACAVAALGAEGDVAISGAEAINKSYPDFYLHLAHLGAIVNHI